ncbi:molybdopterin dinucleotide binding domain protein, partial [Vibrio parahaemolyticus V-223/04]
KA